MICYFSCQRLWICDIVDVLWYDFRAGDSICGMFMDLTNASCVVSNEFVMAWIAYVDLFASGATFHARVPR